MDLLSAESRVRWSRKGSRIVADDQGLLLKPGQDVITAYEGLWLEPGMKVEMRFRVESSEARTAATSPSACSSCPGQELGMDGDGQFLPNAIAANMSFRTFRATRRRRSSASPISAGNGSTCFSTMRRPARR